MLQSQIFRCPERGLTSHTDAVEALPNAVEAATRWMNENANRIAVRHIALGQANATSTVVVWYEDGSQGASS